MMARWRGRELCAQELAWGAGGDRGGARRARIEEVRGYQDGDMLSGALTERLEVEEGGKQLMGVR